MLPPLTKTVPFSFEHLGQKFDDPFAWLQEKNDPLVIAHLEAENAYAQSSLEHTRDLQERLYQEMLARVDEDDNSAPENYGAYVYYTRNEAGRQYRIFCRKLRVPGASEEILLDENVLAEGLGYCEVAYLVPSPDHSRIAYGVDVDGSLVFNLYIKDLSSGQVLSGPIMDTSWDVAWASDSRTVFYALFDSAHRPYKVMRHLSGQDPVQDVLVYHELDEAFSAWLERSRSGAYIFLKISSQAASEVRILPADQPEAEFQLIEPRRPWIEYYLDHHDDDFIIFTNENAPNFRLMRTPVAHYARDNWQELISHRPETLIEFVYAFDQHLAILERSNGLRQLRISAPDGVSDVHYVAFPAPVYAMSPKNNPISATNNLCFSYSTLAQPEMIVNYDMSARHWQVIKQQSIPNGFDPAEYTCERLYAVTADGMQVPVSLVYRGQRSGPRPLLMTGYGAYGGVLEPFFRASRVSLLDRGVIFAIAHVRGGSELGRAWYDGGRLLNKKNTFTDFIACAEYLITQGYTTSGQFAITGRSAGGLLVSAVANLRPGIFPKFWGRSKRKERVNFEAC